MALNGRHEQQAEDGDPGSAEGRRRSNNWNRQALRYRKRSQAKERHDDEGDPHRIMSMDAKPDQASNDRTNTAGSDNCRPRRRSGVEAQTGYRAKDDVGGEK